MASLSALTRLAGRLARPHLPRRTVRLRLTLLYGGLFLISGTVLLAITYALVRNALTGRMAKSFIPAPHHTPVPSPGMPPPGQSRTVQLLPAELQQALQRQTAAMLDQLLINSAIALALMAVISVVLGWIIAGRILSRLRTIIAATEEISATDLHRRLALDGPADELKALGDTIDALLTRLEASFQAQRQFVANASHELRTPLTRQRALGQVVLSDPTATVQSLREAHEQILAAGAHQERLIEALLTLTRGHAGLDVRHPFDLAQLTEEVVHSRSAEAGRRGVTIHASYDVAPVSGHRPLAERLIANLVDNALCYNTSPGWVRVETGTVQGHAVFTISNPGPVVAQDTVERLFQTFQRHGTARATRPDGLGLGLSIVQAIATAHDATITASPRTEGGLTVTVTFPSRPVPRPPARRHRR
ncbi:HAMP domain-containing histidine kinase [Nonomuraea sp. FMUSA5-5]|uniref:histidine kinase n=1 Tax=Nonomuraea composti TaxID=2720023 RepID=A0ABX1BH29_9ACTN|nr:HAMP domain-containing sensor histidine kinase [Nonomuraea sp. FMUSA5-5]NJP97059.1 HAMP domain-containing histidine kinase [Nonomuraea sp. FMUSA5-5]